ncbi:hypothetical protein ACFQS1_36880 [Paractinoplanes rhizophilus]|jgi:hypothetical protein|uniref:Sensor histidine kinase n=1 Tax=Paractinoplanes rhizophilus TaxID=1416877 RepID=A0ABW2I3W3_9ACTN|nr:hypothetical protein [Actinoplanes sp.]
MTSLVRFLIGADPPRIGGRRERVAMVLAVVAAAYLAYAGTTYLDLKSGLPWPLCALGGLALGAPMALIATRPLLAWRLIWPASVITGVAVQAHHRTPFSWHPAILAAQVAILFVVARRLPYAVSLWAWASMAGLVCLSFFPADRLPLIELITLITAMAWGLRGPHRSTESRVARR